MNCDCLAGRVMGRTDSAQIFSDESRREQAEKLFVRVRDLMRTNRSPLFEIARVLGRLVDPLVFVLALGCRR